LPTDAAPGPADAGLRPRIGLSRRPGATLTNCLVDPPPRRKKNRV